MSIFRRVIILSWLRFFFYAFATFMLLVFIATMVDGISRTSVTTVQVLTNFTLDLPKWLIASVPISCLCATLFFIDRLKSKNELIVIFASGFSKSSFILTITFVATLLAAIQFALSSYIQPMMNRIRYNWLVTTKANFKFQGMTGPRKTIISRGKIWFRGPDYFMSFHSFDKKTNTILDLELYRIDHKRHVGEIIKAKDITYEQDDQWKFKTLSHLNHLSYAGFPTVTVLPEMHKKMEMTPQDFKQIEAEVQNLHFQELYEYITKLMASGINTDELQVIFYDKIEVAIICLVFSLLPILAIYNPSKRHSSFGRNAFTAFIFSLIYYFVYTTLLQLGSNGRIPPPLATFIIPTVFSLYLLTQFYRYRKLV